MNLLTLKSASEVLKGLQGLKAELDAEGPSDPWDVRRQLFFQYLRLYQYQAKLDGMSGMPEQLRKIALVKSKTPLSKRDLGYIEKAVTLQKQIAAELRDLKSKGLY